MLEIVILVLLTRQVGKMVRAKGYSGLGYQAATVLLWLGGEMLGLYIGLAFLNEANYQSTIYLVLLIGVLCGGLGGLTAYLIARNLPSRPAAPQNRPDYLPPVSDQANPAGQTPAANHPGANVPATRMPGARTPAEASYRLPPSLPGTPQSVPTAIADGSLLKSYLDYAAAQAKAGLLENAERTLEQGLAINPEWGAALAGGLPATNPPDGLPGRAAGGDLAGYALLLESAGRQNKPQQALAYFKRLLTLNPNLVQEACHLARQAGITEAARQACTELGIAWAE